MSDTNKFNSVVSFLWAIADLLNGAFKKSEFQKIILPFTVLRRLDYALDRALERISASLGPDTRQWRWGAWHPAISGHKPFGKLPFLNALFDVRVESPGDLFSINVGQYWANEKSSPFANRHAASMRAIYDLSPADQSLFVYQTGQSGHVFDPRSRSMAQDWAKGVYYPLQQTSPVIRHHMRLLP